MDATQILVDAATRPAEAAAALTAGLTAEQLNAHPGGHDNSIAWLLWHIGREIDAQVAELSGRPPVWENFRDRFELGELGDQVGYGFTPQQARSIVVDDAGLLQQYLQAATDALVAYLQTLGEEDLDQVIDTSWDPPVTRGARLVSIIDDAAQHIGQVGYARSIAG
ncbi:mycothiol transferase [Naumannella halotolerans]|nr:DinB family protein [Naumannella halotolerans]